MPAIELEIDNNIVCNMLSCHQRLLNLTLLALTRFFFSLLPNQVGRQKSGIHDKIVCNMQC